VRVATSDAEPGGVEVGLAVLPLVDESLISDILAGKLEIAVEDFAERALRFEWGSLGKLRKSGKRAL
jgi:hypothetical protein